MELAEIRQIVSEIRYKDRQFVLGVIPVDGLCWLQVHYPVINNGVERTAKGRRWIIEPNSVPWQVLATAFKAALTVEEHEARESFLYKGTSVFFPHQELEELVGFRKQIVKAHGPSEEEARHAQEA